MSAEGNPPRFAAALECGGEFLSVALASFQTGESGLEVTFLETLAEHRGHRHADVVLSELARMLKRHVTDSQKCHLIAAGRGPGGFTGVRVGLATAQGLAMGWNVPFWGVCSLETLVLNEGGKPGFVAPMLDARRGQIYASLYRVDANGLRTCVSEPQVGDPTRIVERYATFASNGPIRCLGSGALAYDLADEQNPEAHQPSARHTLTLALAAWHAAGQPAEGMLVDPLYLRPSDAEIDYNRRHGKDRADS